MFALQLELLAGRYVATAYNNRNVAEWPPHPARLYSALVATWADVRDPDTARDDAHVKALQWLEQLPAPEIRASGMEEVGRRSVMTNYVPVNDVHVVSAPDTEKLRAAELAQLDATSSKARDAANKLHKKLREKLLTDTTRLTSPGKPGKDDAANARAWMPDTRTRQPRTFPSLTPEHPEIWFVWPDVEASGDVHASLSQLARSVVRLGHSSSPVRLSVLDNIDGLSPTLAQFRPNPDGMLVLRCTSAGQLALLQEQFTRHHGTEPRVMPAQFVRYDEASQGPAVAADVAESVWGADFFVFARVDGPRMPLVAATRLTERFRNELTNALDQPHSFLTGQDPSSGPLQKGHVAIFPLPFVAHRHSDGTMLGLGIAVPRDRDPGDWHALLQAIGALERGASTDDTEDGPGVVRLELGNLEELKLQRLEWGLSTQQALRTRHWTTPSVEWVTATPIALDRNPGNLHDKDPGKQHAAWARAEELVRSAIARVVPTATVQALQLDRAPLLAGTPPARAFGRFPANEERQARVLVHARVRFTTPVLGPLLIGAGRYQGMGLMLPTEATSLSREETR